MAMRRVAKLLLPHGCRYMSSTTRQVGEEILHPIAYYRKFPMCRDGRNNMMPKFPKKKNPLLPSDTGIISSRSLAKLVASYHARRRCLGKALTLDNVAVSTKTHEFLLMDIDESNLPDLTEAGRVADLNNTGSILEFSVKKAWRFAHSSPPAYDDLLKKLKSQNPQYKLIIYHPWFFSRYAAFWFRFMVDLRLRKEFNHHKGNVSVKGIEIILGEIPHSDVNEAENLVPIAKRNVVVNALLRKRKMTPDQRSEKSFMPKWSNNRVEIARLVVCVNRDGLAHVFETELGKSGYILKMKMSLEKAIDMLRLEFPDYEYKTLDLFERQKMYSDLGMPELFGEDSKTWEAVFHSDEIYTVNKRA